MDESMVVYQFETTRTKVGDIGPRFESDNLGPLVAFVRPLFEGRYTERMVAVYCDAAARVIGYQVVADGSSVATIVSPSDIFANALRAGALGFFLIHSHPAGLLDPSEDDAQMTMQIYEGAHLVGLHLMDHIIINDDGFLSMRTESNKVGKTNKILTELMSIPPEIMQDPVGRQLAASMVSSLAVEAMDPDVSDEVRNTLALFGKYLSGEIDKQTFALLMEKSYQRARANGELPPDAPETLISAADLARLANDDEHRGPLN